jgi:CRISPR-associated protein Cmr4
LAVRLFSGDQKDWQPEFIKRFAVVSDDSFNFFCETGTEVSPHVKIKPDTKTVQTGALWFQEAIPAESILSGMVWCDWVFAGSKDQRLGQAQMNEERKRLLTKFCPPETILQIGGNATTGKGRVRCLFTGGGDKP